MNRIGICITKSQGHRSGFECLFGTKDHRMLLEKVAKWFNDSQIMHLAIQSLGVLIEGKQMDKC